MNPLFTVFETANVKNVKKRSLLLIVRCSDRVCDVVKCTHPSNKERSKAAIVLARAKKGWIFNNFPKIVRLRLAFFFFFSFSFSLQEVMCYHSARAALLHRKSSHPSFYRRCYRTCECVAANVPLLLMHPSFLSCLSSSGGDPVSLLITLVIRFYSQHSPKALKRFILKCISADSSRNLRSVDNRNARELDREGPCLSQTYAVYLAHPRRSCPRKLSLLKPSIPFEEHLAMR